MRIAKVNGRIGSVELEQFVYESKVLTQMREGGAMDPGLGQKRCGNTVEIAKDIVGKMCSESGFDCAYALRKSATEDSIGLVLFQQCCTQIDAGSRSVPTRG